MRAQTRFKSTFVQEDEDVNRCLFQGKQDTLVASHQPPQSGVLSGFARTQSGQSPDTLFIFYVPKLKPLCTQISNELKV